MMMITKYIKLKKKKKTITVLSSIYTCILLVWFDCFLFVWVLWQINFCWLFNPRFKQIYFM